MEERPGIKELKDLLLPRLAPDWKDFCIAANFDSDGTTLSTIDTTYRGNPVDCCREVLIKLVRDQKPTWKTVIEYLKSTRCGQLTRDVEEFVKSSMQRNDESKGTQRPKITLKSLKSMVDKVGQPVKIIQRIAAGMYKDFGMYLLDDENMTEVDVLERHHIHQGPAGITEAIIKEWLVSGSTPRTWEHLIKCIRNCGLGTLAEDIENALSGSNEATPAPVPAVSIASTSTALPIPIVSVGSSGSHPVATDDAGPEESELCKKSPIEIWGSGFKRSILETPDPASYWSLNEVCKTYRGNGLKLLMFDTGITHEPHPSFAQAKIQTFGNCDDLDGHGTCCAGIACGNELSVANVHGLPVTCRGVAPNANLVIWKAYDYAKEIPIEPWLQRLEDMASNCDGMDVVVISSGFEEPIKRMKGAIKKLDNKGVIVVCAAGNDGAKDSHNVNIKYPARYPQTICVGAHDRDGHPCGFSSVGEIDVFALGKDIIGPNRVDTTLEDSNIYKYLRQGDGTSFAAPAVGALICLILEAVKDTCRREHYDQIKEADSMRKLLLKLATEKRVISCKQLENFFNKDSRFYLGPNHFIQEMVSSREI